MTGNAIARAKSKEIKIEIGQVAILDAGAQYGKVIDRRIRNLLVKSDILPINAPLDQLRKYKALVISGGPEDVFAPNAPKPDPRVFELGKPILGICYGMQLMNQFFEGTVEKGKIREDGQFEIDIDSEDPLFSGLESKQKVLLTHGNSATKAGKGFKVIAKSENVMAAISNREKKLYGVQFHPEVDLTQNGKIILSNFLFKIADCRPSYKLEDKLSKSINYIKKTVGENDVVVFVSGGVDSTVCAVLLAKALPPKQIHAVHIDSGLMRLDESKSVKRTLNGTGIKLQIIDARQQFLNGTTMIDGKKTLPLNKVSDPEVKRRIIGDTFIKVMDKVTAQLRLDPEKTVLVQGTLRPDLIESASKMASSSASVIKTHHNDTHLVRQLRETGRVIEPLQELHKDEVRQIGERLGLPADLVWRQPFPGPGLAVRLLCTGKTKLGNLFTKLEKEVKQFGDPDIAATLLPIRSVGVQGDGRSYGYVVALSGKADWQRLMTKAREIPKRIHGVNRIVYFFGEKIEGTAYDTTPTLPTKAAFDQLRQADDRVNTSLKKFGLDKSLSQVPVISIPVNFGQHGKRSIVIRTFITNDFMTGVPAAPGQEISEVALKSMTEDLLLVPGIVRVAYDLTSKPPGTTEWE